MTKVCTSCEKSGGIECSIKHNQEAIVFLQEALTRPIDDARTRCLNAYGHLSHSSDVHLPDAHPEMASRCRQIRKMLEPCIYKRSDACPPKGCIEEIETFQAELQDTLHGMEHGKRKEEEVVAHLPTHAHEQKIAVAQEVDFTTHEKEDYTPFLIIGGVVSLLVGAMVAQRLRLSSPKF